MVLVRWKLTSSEVYRWDMPLDRRALSTDYGLSFQEHQVGRTWSPWVLCSVSYGPINRYRGCDKNASYAVLDCSSGEQIQSNTKTPPRPRAILRATWLRWSNNRSVLGIWHLRTVEAQNRPSKRRTRTCKYCPANSAKVCCSIEQTIFYQLICHVWKSRCILEHCSEKQIQRALVHREKLPHH